MCATLISQQSFGQAWEKGSKVLGLGLGASQFFHINPNDATDFYAPVSGQFNLQMEFGVHDYVGVGFQTGFGGSAPIGGRYYGLGYGYYGYGRYAGYGSFNVPISGFANFHFYQLIADKTGSNIHADKLDIYAGLNLGTGLGVLFFNDPLVTPIVFGGFQAGARYYFTDKFGVNLELGYGKSIVNGGVVFNL